MTSPNNDPQIILLVFGSLFAALGLAGTVMLAVQKSNDKLPVTLVSYGLAIVMFASSLVIS